MKCIIRDKAKEPDENLKRRLKTNLTLLFNVYNYLEELIAFRNVVSEYISLFNLKNSHLSKISHQISVNIDKIEKFLFFDAKNCNNLKNKDSLLVNQYKLLDNINEILKYQYELKRHFFNLKNYIYIFPKIGVPIIFFEAVIWKIDTHDKRATVYYVLPSKAEFKFLKALIEKRKKKI